MKALIVFIILLFSFVPQSLNKPRNISGYYDDGKYIVVKVNPTNMSVITCYKNSDGEVIGDFERLDQHISSTGHDLIFACNGGMFMTDLRPLGLYVENGRTLMPLNTRSASTNFYIKPNGVFYILYNGEVGLCKTEVYQGCVNVKYATQSGPMLVIDGVINPKFIETSRSYRVRNGVGMNRDGEVVFILSQYGVTFYDFAYTFQQVGCDNALFLDGDISAFYCPEVGLDWAYCYASVFIAVVK